MTSHPPTLADRFAGLRATLQDRTGDVRPESGAVLDAMLLALIVLLGRLERLARAWHPAPEGMICTEDGEYFEHSLLSFLWLIGAGPNRGARPHARTAPFARARSARAPPSPILRPVGPLIAPRLRSL